MNSFMTGRQLLYYDGMDMITRTVGNMSPGETFYRCGDLFGGTVIYKTNQKPNIPERGNLGEKALPYAGQRREGGILYQRTFCLKAWTAIRFWRCRREVIKAAVSDNPEKSAC